MTQHKVDRKQRKNTNVEKQGSVTSSSDYKYHSGYLMGLFLAIRYNAIARASGSGRSEK